MKELIATKAMTYATRRLLPGDTFAVKKPADARVLLAIGKAREPRDQGSLPPPPAAVVEKAKRAAPAKRTAALDHDHNGKAGGFKAAAGDDLTELRREYAEKVGKRPFPGWGAAELRRRIAEAG